MLVCQREVCWNESQIAFAEGTVCRLRGTGPVYFDLACSAPVAGGNTRTQYIPVVAFHPTPCQRLSAARNGDVLMVQGHILTGAVKRAKTAHLCLHSYRSLSGASGSFHDAEQLGYQEARLEKWDPRFTGE